MTVKIVPSQEKPGRSAVRDLCGFTLPAELFAELEAYSDEQRITRSTALREAVSAYLYGEIR